jgi:hypothetical protein
VDIRPVQAAASSFLKTVNRAPANRRADARPAWHYGTPNPIVLATFLASLYSFVIVPPISFTCPRCLYSAHRDADSRFCPRCGLCDEPAARDDERMEVWVNGAVVKIGKRLAFGVVCNLYHCSFKQGGSASVFKVTRSHFANAHLAREVSTLNRLLDADEDRFAPFLPHPLGTSDIVQAEGEPPRLAAVLSYEDEIVSPDDLYSLQEVREAYPDGIDARDMAWMWRRLLTILGYVHQRGFAHGLVTPDHILIEPRDHKLVLISWCAAVPLGSPPLLVPIRWMDWLDATKPLSPSTDLGCGGRSMLSLLNASADPAITRHLHRAATLAEAWKLLEDFDRLIEALWGPRQFRKFTMARRI